jgi:hypothetical protein
VQRRFISCANQRTGDKGNQIFGSPWWFSKETFKWIMAHADPRGLGIGDVARIHLAVPKEFNLKMEWICVIFLVESVYGWSGKAARQLVTQKSNLYFGGGGNQIFLPNLSTDPSKITSRYARMRFFGACSDFA